MYFEYSKYLRFGLIQPALVLAFSFAAFVPGLINYFRAFLEKKIIWKRLPHLILCLMVISIFVVVGAGSLIRGGYHLLFERESDALPLYGQIEQIEELRLCSFTRLDCEYSDGTTTGVCITIDGVSYVAFEKGTLEVGNYVTGEYLPASRYILCIDATSTESN